MKPAPATTHYTALLADIKQRIRQAQTRAVLAVNAERRQAEIFYVLLSCKA